MPATVEAIEELYRSRYASYRGGVAALLGSYDGARDVVQEAFAQAIRDRRDYRGEGPLAAWVWRIAVRTALRGRGAGGSDLPLEEAFETASPHAERDSELAEALKRLSPRRRMVVYLRYFADLPYAEIASLLDISEGTVAATLSQAHAELLEQLRDKEATTP
ncbi:MAG TPA: RNA polymerase sigma factor [Gaiellaceae bacterium]|nr:RNA polymerase sigma factor [Gaiellaceae bacterium]